MDRIEWFVIAAIVTILAGTAAAAVLMPRYQCESQAKVMNMRNDWGIVQGCMIEHKPGQWIPLKNYRVIP